MIIKCVPSFALIFLNKFLWVNSSWRHHRYLGIWFQTDPNTHPIHHSSHRHHRSLWKRRCTRLVLWIFAIETSFFTSSRSRFIETVFRTITSTIIYHTFCDDFSTSWDSVTHSPCINVDLQNGQKHIVSMSYEVPLSATPTIVFASTLKMLNKLISNIIFRIRSSNVQVRPSLCLLYGIVSYSHLWINLHYWHFNSCFALWISITLFFSFLEQFRLRSLFRYPIVVRN